MLDSFLRDFSFIRDTFEKGGDLNFFEKDFSFFSAEPTLFYNNANDKIVYMNSMFTNEFGYTVQDIAEWNYSIFPLLNKEDQESFRTAMKTLPDGDESTTFPGTNYRLISKKRKSGNYHVKVRKLYKSYYYIQLESTASLALPALEKGLQEMSHAQNIMLQEEGMKALADYKSMMFENETFLNYGTWESDADGNSIFWSEGMYNIFGYDEFEKRGLVVNKDLYSTHMLSENYESSRSKNILNNNKDHYLFDYKIKDHKGNTKLLSTYGKIIRNNEGDIQKIIGTTKDVTELKEYERTLESKIMELNRSNRELEEFAYVASHDLQEPLRKISTFGQRLQLRFSEKLGSDGNLYIDRMVAACDNMRKLIDNLLEFSRISLNKSPFEQIELNEIVKQAMDGLDLIIAEANAVITVGQLPAIEGISSQMLQVFSNILNNSIKFRKDDSPLIINIDSGKLSEKEKKDYQLESSIDYFMILIKDNGIGFEQEYASKIFQVFQRLQGKSEYPGTGIGLSICKKIITNHKGLIFAESEPGQGASFSIILPQHQ